MDHVAYGEIHKHLSDTTFYRKLSHNPTAMFEQQIRNKLDLLLKTGEILKVEHVHVSGLLQYVLFCSASIRSTKATQMYPQVDLL